MVFGLQCRSDSDLWKELKAGNRAAFVHIYNLYSEDLIRYGRQLVTNKCLVEDVVQDVFVLLWEKRENQAEVHAIKFYLLSTTRRMLLRKIKKERIFVFDKPKARGVFEIVPSYLDETIDMQRETALIEKIRRVINGLTDRQREIIYLKFYQNLSYAQIAELLNLNQKYTYNLASRAFSCFKEKFKSIATFFFL